MFCYAYIYIHINMCTDVYCKLIFYRNPQERSNGVLHLQGGVVIVTISFHLSEIQFSLKKCSGCICAGVETPI